MFSELAHGYYEDCMRRVRSHRVEAAASHYILTTRHQFKLGFFAELGGLSADALKCVRFIASPVALLAWL